MAESVAAIDLATSIVTLADKVNKSIVRLQSLRCRIIEVPKDFRDILVMLSDFFEILEDTKKLYLAGLIEKPAQVAFLPLVQSCDAELIELSNILKEITPRKIKDSTSKAKKAFQGFLYKKAVKKISSTLQKNILVIMHDPGLCQAMSQYRSFHLDTSQADIPFETNLSSLGLSGAKSEWTFLTKSSLNYRTNPFDTNEGISQQSLIRQEQILGSEHPDTLSGASNLAKRLIQELRYDEAKPLALRALAGSKKVLGAENLQTLAAMETLAILYKCVEQYKSSATYFEMALKGFNKVLGQDNSRTQSCWWEYLSLEEKWTTLHKDPSKLFPPNHPVSLIRLKNEASIVFETGNYRQAEESQRNSLALFVAKVGRDNLWSLKCVYDLGLTLIELWNFSEAEELFRQVLERRRRKLKSDHQDILQTMNALAVTLWNKKGEGLIEAEAIFRELLATRERLGQTEDISYLSTRNNLALLEFERGDNEAALATHRALLIDRQRIQGENHPETLLTMLSISMALGYMYQYKDALEWNQKAVYGLLIFPGPNHPNTLVARSHLAKIQSMVGELGAAEETIRSVIAARSSVLGPGHGNTLKSRARLGGILELQGRFREALSLEEDVYTMAVASLGIDHPETRGHKKRLEALRQRVDLATNCGTENHDDHSRIKG